MPSAGQRHLAELLSAGLLGLRYLRAIPGDLGLLFLPGHPSLLLLHLGLLLPEGNGDGGGHEGHVSDKLFLHSGVLEMGVGAGQGGNRGGRRWECLAGGGRLGTPRIPDLACLCPARVPCIPVETGRSPKRDGEGDTNPHGFGRGDTLHGRKTRTLQRLAGRCPKSPLKL